MLVCVEKHFCKRDKVTCKYKVIFCFIYWQKIKNFFKGFLVRTLNCNGCEALWNVELTLNWWLLSGSLWPIAWYCETTKWSWWSSRLGLQNSLTASLQMGKTPSPNECPGYDTKQSDGEALVLEFWGMWSSSSLPSLPGPLWPGVLASDRVLSMSQIEVFESVR